MILTEPPYQFRLVNQCRVHETFCGFVRGARCGNFGQGIRERLLDQHGHFRQAQGQGRFQPVAAVNAAVGVAVEWRHQQGMLQQKSQPRQLRFE
jgi:hypothetical protein